MPPYEQPEISATLIGNYAPDLPSSALQHLQRRDRLLFVQRSALGLGDDMVSGAQACLTVATACAVSSTDIPQLALPPRSGSN
jgi:hypothetical protein